MSSLNGTGIPFARLLRDRDRHVRYVRQRPLHHVLAFTRKTIDDVVNDPIAKNAVLGYYKLHKQIERASEIRELERQWNPIG